MVSGRERRKVKSAPPLFITHHALSRAAQRWGARTPENMITVVYAIWDRMMEYTVDLKGEFWITPPEGVRVNLDSVDSDQLIVVLKGHSTRKALVAATVI
jgi:hypothetical protein